MHNTVDADLLKKDLEAKLQRLVQEDLRIVPAWELAEYADGWGKQMSPRRVPYFKTQSFRYSIVQTNTSIAYINILCIYKVYI